MQDGLLASTDKDTPAKSIPVRRRFNGGPQIRVLHFKAKVFYPDDTPLNPVDSVDSPDSETNKAASQADSEVSQVATLDQDKTNLVDSVDSEHKADGVRTAATPIEPVSIDPQNSHHSLHSLPISKTKSAVNQPVEPEEKKTPNTGSQRVPPANESLPTPPRSLRSSLGTEAKKKKVVSSPTLEEVNRLVAAGKAEVF